jgi:hypothetical protein
MGSSSKQPHTAAQAGQVTGSSGQLVTHSQCTLMENFKTKNNTLKKISD